MTKNVILSALAIVVFAGCTGKDKATTTVQEKQQAIPVKVLKLEKESIAKTLDYTANLVAQEEINYAPASPGRIQKIYVEVGDRIQKGQVLVAMDQSLLLQAETQLKNLKAEYDRAVQLNETGSISSQKYEAAETAYETAETNVKFLKENTVLTAPFDGVVTGKYYENGEMYSGLPNTKSGKAAVITIEQINPLKAHVNLTEQYYPSIKKGIKIELRSNIYPDRVFPGEVSIVYPTIDNTSRTFTVEVRIQNNDLALRPGMFGMINFFIGEANTIVVPALAVLKLQGSNERYVFLNDHGKAKRVSVKIGRRFEDKVEIISDQVKEGDEMVVVGQARLIDGTAITATE